MTSPPALRRMGPQADFPFEDLLPLLELPAPKVGLSGAPALRFCPTPPVDLESIPELTLPPPARAAATECVHSDEAMCAEDHLARSRPAAVPVLSPREPPVDMGSVPDIAMPELALHDGEDCPCSVGLHPAAGMELHPIMSEGASWGALKEEEVDMMFIMEGFNDNEPAEAGDRKGDVETPFLPEYKVSARLAAAFGLDDYAYCGSTYGGSPGSASPISSARSPSPNAWSPRSCSDEAYVLDMRPSPLLEGLFGDSGSCERSEARKPNWNACVRGRARTYSDSTVASESYLSLACHGRVDSNMSLGSRCRLDSNMSLGGLGLFDMSKSDRSVCSARTPSPPSCLGCSRAP